MKNNGTGMNYVALRQAIQGKLLMFGGFNNDDDEDEIDNVPFWTSTDKPVYHVTNAKFDLPMFDDSRWDIRPRKWGSFNHPFLMIGMPDAGGDVILHVDTRFEGWYVMTASVKLDPWMCGPSDWAKDVVCWTPKCPGDNLNIAGERMFRALAMRMDCVEEGETKSTLYEDEEWEDNWDCSDSCLKVFREIRNGE